jgi:hypothetical protein
MGRATGGVRSGLENVGFQFLSLRQFYREHLSPMGSTALKSAIIMGLRAKTSALR